jgi:hypothetical protein
MKGISFGFLALCAGLGLSSGARASFELVMVADTGTKSIHRFDGTTGVYLGSFGGGFLASPESFVIDSVNHLAYVGDFGLGRTRVFNYNTGVLVRDIAVGGNGLYQTLGLMGNGNLCVGYNNGGFGAYTPNGAYAANIQNQNVAGMSASGMGSVAHRSGRTFLSTYRSDSLAGAAIQISSGSGLNIYKSAEITTVGGWVDRAQLAMQGDRGIWMSANRTMQNFTTNAAGSTIAFGSSYALTDFFNNSANGVGFGHGDSVYVAGRNSGNTSGVIGRYLYGNSTQLSSFGSGIIQTPGMVQVVVAPEPGSMIALGLGLAGVLGRRRAMRKSA